jgi:hypothetical protein
MSNSGLVPAVGGAFVQAAQQVEPVHGVDRVESRGSAARLVRLQVTHQVPPERRVGERIDLRQGFLHPVLAEVGLSGSRRGADGLGRKRLRDGDEANGGGVTAGRACRAVEAGTHGQQTGADAVGVRGQGYFLRPGFSASMAPLTSAACGPSGSACK